ncbi:hypothetical protein J3A83DRAFT_4374201 [Scleroderma citrinum]
MSSRTDYRRRERSWEREDRDRDRYRDRDRDRYSRSGRQSNYRDSTRRRDSTPSPRRSRSPRRDRAEHDRERGKDRDHKSSKRDDRRDRDRDDRKSDPRDERRSSKRDDRHGHETPDRGSTNDADARTKGTTHRARHQDEHDAELASEQMQSPQASMSKQDLDLNAGPEEGEEMDVTNADDEAMMAAMGLSGFGSTKGKRVEGNQEGAANVKKIRTWRQYMNRRGGFNRPLDKIK